MEPHISSTHSLQPTVGPKSCTTEIHSLLNIRLPEDPFQSHSLIYGRIFHWLFTSGFPTNKIYAILPSPMSATWTAKPILLVSSREKYIVIYADH